MCVGEFHKKTFIERFGDHFGSFSHDHPVIHSLFPYKSKSRVCLAFKHNPNTPSLAISCRRYLRRFSTSDIVSP